MAARSTKGEVRQFLGVMALALLAIVAILSLQPGSVQLGALADIRLRAPDFEPLWRQSLLVQIHVLTVFYALATGPVQFLLPKGTGFHRALGWTWAGAMLVTAISSLFIREINDGGFSPIHFFSVWTFVSLPLAVWLARRGDIRAHRGIMIGLYIGLIIAGVLAIAPGRVIWAMFFG